MSEERALTKREDPFVALQQQTENLDKLYRSLMKKETDYGVVPGTNKPTLYKPGAELLRLWGRYGVDFILRATQEDYAKGIFAYDCLCFVSNEDGVRIGTGVGSCNSMETKYRWRWVWENQLPKGIAKEGLVSKQTERGHTQYRIDIENPADLVNTYQKMAKKRAFIDGMLTVTGASRIFTQDIEDIGDGQGDGQKEGVNGGHKATEKQLNYLNALAKKKLGLSKEKFAASVHKKHGRYPQELSGEQVSAMIEQYQTMPDKDGEPVVVDTPPVEAESIVIPKFANWQAWEDWWKKEHNITREMVLEASGKKAFLDFASHEEANLYALGILLARKRAKEEAEELY